MINPITFLWKQLNGPQITAICQAIWLYFKNTYDANLEYLHGLSIATAKTNHLTFIGILQGLARPLIPIPDEDKFWFTNVDNYGYIEGYGYESETWYPGHKVSIDFPSKHGFAPLTNRTLGGVLSAVKDAAGYSYIPDFIFRACLQGNSQSSGALGSLVGLDDIVFAMWRKEHSSLVPQYKIIWTNKWTHPLYSPGDLLLDMGVSGDWSNPYVVNAELKLLGQTVYYPIPRLFPLLKEGDSLIEVPGFIRILVTGKEQNVPPYPDPIYVPGLNDIWNENIAPPDTVEDGESPAFSTAPITDAELNTMWSQNQEWIDEVAPDPDFEALAPEVLAAMWD